MKLSEPSAFSSVKLRQKLLSFTPALPISTEVAFNIQNCDSSTNSFYYLGREGRRGRVMPAGAKNFEFWSTRSQFLTGKEKGEKLLFPLTGK